MVALHLMGKRIQAFHGSKMIWMLYLGGAIAGSVAMNYYMPYHSIPIPQVGADPAMASFFGFMAAVAPRATAFTLVVPVKFWFLLLMSTFLMTVSDSSCKNLGGLAMGVGLGLLKRPFLF
jgi:membrane associated rhomboid family serine protease